MNAPKSRTKMDLAELLADHPSWFDVYNHRDCKNINKIPATAELITSHLDNIHSPLIVGTSRTGFFPSRHNGKPNTKGMDPATSNYQIEKRICYACYNQTHKDLAKANTDPWITFDYEIQLKSTRADKIGRIDLAGWHPPSSVLFLIEAKAPDCTESPIKALVEIMAYTLSLNARRVMFANATRVAILKHLCISITGDIYLQPALLLFARSETAVQLQSPVPQLRELIQRLDQKLDADGFLPLAFFIEHDAQGLQKKLVCGESPVFNGWTPNITRLHL